MRILFILLFLLPQLVLADFNVTPGTGQTINTGAGNVSTGTQRVTIATDDSNLAAIKTAVQLIDNGISGSEFQCDIVTSALPTGASTSALQTTGNGILTTIDADTGTLAGTVSGSEQQVDVVASLPAGTNNIGDIDVLTTPEVSEYSVATSNSTPITTATTTTVISAPSAGNHIRIYKILAQNSSSTPVEVGFKIASGSTLFENVLSEYQPMALSALPSYLKVTSATAFQMVTSASGSVTYTVLYKVFPD